MSATTRPFVAIATRTRKSDGKADHKPNTFQTPQTRLAGALITAAVDSLAGLLDEEFLRLGGGDIAAVVKAYAADHRHTS